MDPLVPLLIPEVNAEHLALLAEQRKAKGWTGAIVTNPNCSTVVLAMALAPLRQFGIRAVIVTTMQAVSGAGYPGVPSLDILGNVIPFIGGGEEEKIETETLKILGGDGGRAPLSGRRQRAGQSRARDRRPHDDGLRGPGSRIRRRRGRRRRCERSAAGRRNSSCRPRRIRPIVVMTETNRPQPRLDADLRRRHDGLGRPRPRVPGADAQVRRARPQYDSRRGRRVGAQCGADAGRRAALKLTMKRASSAQARSGRA